MGESSKKMQVSHFKTDLGISVVPIKMSCYNDSDNVDADCYHKTQKGPVAQLSLWISQTLILATHTSLWSYLLYTCIYSNVYVIQVLWKRKT